MTGTGGGHVDAHTRLYAALAVPGLLRGEPAPRHYVERLRRVWWRLDRALDEDILRAAARLAVTEALLSGTTGMVDHHQSPHCIEGSLDVLADVCQDLGMRAVLGYAVTERNGGREEARRGIEEGARFLASNRRPLVRGVLGVHASFTVSDETLREVGGIARDLGTVVHASVSEDEADSADARVRGAASALRRMLACDALPPGSIVAHGVHLDADEVELANESGLWIVQTPRANRENGVGYPRALHRSRRVALGTDEFPSDLVEEAATLLETGADGEPDLGAALRRMDGGRALLSERFAAGGGLPEAVVRRGEVAVDGRAVVSDGRLTTADEDDVRDEAERQSRRLRERMASL